MIERLRVSLYKALKRQLGEITHVSVEVIGDGDICIQTSSDYGPSFGPIIINPQGLLDTAMGLFVKEMIEEELRDVGSN